jgi:PhnB protein
VKAGAKVEMPLQNQFWGHRYGKVRDPFGHRWGLAQHVEEGRRPDELERRSNALMAQISKASGHD